jgi:SulP family sulfate permease
MLQRSDLASLPKDLVAGIVLGAVMVPVGLAFGSLAGAPLAGLYAGMLPLVVYAVLGSSRQLIVGPDASMAALVAASVAPLAIGDVGRLTVLSGTLAVLIGLLCVAGGLARLGFLADLLSKGVVVGFMNGLAVVIAVGQLPKVLGIEAAGSTTLQQIVDIARHLGGTNPHSLAIGAGTVAVILACRRWAPAVPGQVVALALATFAVVLFDLERHGVGVVGTVPAGLPGFQLPSLALDDIKALLPIAFVAALVSFSDTMVTGRGFASRNHYQIDANRELIAVGAANIASGLTQGLPISASGARTAVAEAAGGRTQLVSVIAALTVVAAMLFLTPVLFHLPHAALGGVLLAAAWSLCDFRELGRLWRFQPSSLVGALVPMAGVIALGVMEGIGIGVVLSFILVGHALAVPADAVLGRTASGEWHDILDDARPVPGAIVYRFSAPLFFVNVSAFRKRLTALVDEAGESPSAVVIDGSAMSTVDLAACEMLDDLVGRLGDRGIAFAIANMNGPARQRLERGWPRAAAGKNLLFPSVDAAVQALVKTTNQERSGVPAQ